MINALRKELSKTAITKMTSGELQENIDGVNEIIFDQWLDGLPENYDAGEYYLEDIEYNLANEILTELYSQLNLTRG